MRSIDLICFATRSLGANRLRSGLTTLGVLFGVGSVVLMIAIGQGTHARIREEIERLGTNLILVLPGAANSGGVRLGSASRPTLSDGDAVAIATQAAGLLAAAPAVRGSVHLTTGATNWSSQLVGIDESFFVARDWRVADGREVYSADLAERAKIALVGRTVAEKLFDGSDPLDEAVRINHLPFKIIGVLEEKGQTLSGVDLDDVVMVPLTTARDSLLGRSIAKARSVDVIMVKVADREWVSDAIEEVRAVLREHHSLRDDQPDDFAIRNIVETMQVQEDSSAALTQLLAAVASISLLVGGIGIMNVMLVSVVERTREIGIRMAVGAKPRHIMAQFLTEATLLSVAGGMAGAFLGLVSTVIAERQFGIRVEVTHEPLAVAFTFSVLVGLVFGFYPALKAAQKMPSEVLRYE